MKSYAVISYTDHGQQWQWTYVKAISEIDALSIVADEDLDWIPIAAFEARDLRQIAHNIETGKGQL